MQPIRPAFNRAAAGKPAARPRVSVFWLMVFAVAIIDDTDRRDEQRRRKRRTPQPQRKPKRPSGPRPV